MAVIKKKDLHEIINGNDDLIGTNDIPTNGADLETQAKGTTDQNVGKAAQPFRYDMLGRFGFTLMPFMEEGKDGNENQEQSEMFSELINLMYDRYEEIIKFYYKNPNKLKSDYRKMSADGGDTQKAVNVEYAKKIVVIVKKYFDESLKNLDEQFQENLVESKVLEDKMVDKKEDKMAQKTEDNGVMTKRLEKIAGLINKLEKGDIDKLINLLERKQ